MYRYFYYSLNSVLCSFKGIENYPLRICSILPLALLTFSKAEKDQRLEGSSCRDSGSGDLSGSADAGRNGLGSDGQQAEGSLLSRQGLGFRSLGLSLLGHEDARVADGQRHGQETSEQLQVLVKWQFFYVRINLLRLRILAIKFYGTKTH